MNQWQLDLKLLLQRTNLSPVFSEFLHEVERQYPAVGKVMHYEPIVEGYEDANIKIDTDRGLFVVKIFSKARTAENCQSYIKILEESNRVGVPVVDLVSGKVGPLGEYRNKNRTSRFIVTEFFKGQNFERITPTLKDMKILTNHLAKLNSFQFSVSESYDSWGNKNLLKEYAQNRYQLRPEQDNLLRSAVSQYTHVDTSRFSKGVIHADMQRKHVLKNMKRDYCILDFGCARHDGKVFELSTYLAWFCLGIDTWGHKDEIVHKVTREYLKTHKLSEYELEALPVLTEAAFAAYFLKASVLTNIGDGNQETAQWLELSKELLHRSQSWKWPGFK